MWHVRASRDSDELDLPRYGGPAVHTPRGGEVEFALYHQYFSLP